MIRWPIHLLFWAGALAAALLTYRIGGASAILLLFSAGLAGAALTLLIRRQRSATNRDVGGPPKTDSDGSVAPPLSVGIAKSGTAVISPSALLEATLNSMREGVLVVGPDLQILSSNAAARTLFDPGEAPLESRRLIDVTRLPSIHEAFRTALETGERAEATVETQNNGRRAFELRVAPMRVGGGEQGRGAIGVFFDITRLEALERTRQEFLLNVSHELRTPLTAIVAFVETLEEGAIDDPENNWRFLEIIAKNARRMQDLIEDILDLASIESGNVTLDLAPVRLSPLVNDVCASVMARANGRQVNLTNQVPADVLVNADPRRLEQMLTNLVDNAVKFNRDGGTVTVSCEADDHVRINVADTGEGISPDQVARIFERFYRVDRARSREMGGNGLGLAIVKHLARAHGGEAHVRSTLGDGSVFTIELPGSR